MTIPSSTPVCTRTEGRKAFLHSMFTTALEGGLNCWAQVGDYRWMNPNRKPESRITDNDYLDLDGFYALITSAEGDWGVDRLSSGYALAENEPILIDIDVIERGVNLMVEKVIAATTSEDPDAPFSRKYLRQFVIQWLTDADEGDSDAEVADMVVQLGLFGTLVYG